MLLIIGKFVLCEASCMDVKVIIIDVKPSN